MPNYRRAWVPGGTWFFTVNLLQRHNNDLLVRHIDALRTAVMETQRLNPFTIHGFVVLPEHLHAVLELPQGESDFALRWRRIKMLFSKSLPNTEPRVRRINFSAHRAYGGLTLRGRAEPRSVSAACFLPVCSWC